METGHDILFFWVARMVMLGLELTNELPFKVCIFLSLVVLLSRFNNELFFKEVLLHGVLCDAQGKKMSKSRGNVIFPENVIDGISLKVCMITLVINTFYYNLYDRHICSLKKLNEQAKKSFEDGILNQAELKRTIALNTKMFSNGVPECGVDALRYTLCSHNIKGE